MAAMVSCDDAPDVRPEVTDFVVRDSAGIEIVESGTPLWTEETRWTIDPDPALVIRTQERGNAPFLLYAIDSILRLSDGRLLVMSRAERALFVFDENGQFLEAWGGPGQGPGEFTEFLLQALRCAGDTTVVLQSGTSQSATVLDDAGSVTRVYRMPVMFGLDQPVVGLSDDCTTLLLHHRERAWMPGGFSDTTNALSLAEGQGYGIVPGTVIRVDLGRDRADTIGVFGDLETFQNPGKVTPFKLVAGYTMSGQYLLYAWGDAPEIDLYDLEGRLRRRIRWRAPPEPITDADWERYAAERDSFIGDDPSKAPFVSGPRENRLHDVRPWFSAERFAGPLLPLLLIDDRANVWLQRYSRRSLLDTAVPASRWWVFDPSGRWLGEVETPAGLLIRSIAGGHLYGIWIDAFDVEQVRAYRIVQARDDG